MIGEIAHRTGRALAQKYDDVIADAVGGWAVLSSDLLGRMSRRVYPDGIEEIVLDGEPIVQFWPVQIRYGTGPDRHKMFASRQYQVF